VRPLTRPDTRALVRALARTGDEAALDRLAAQAWAVSEGNPFVVVETVRAHAEGAALAQGRGLGLPERVREMVGRRLERLSERAQSLAAVAAVIGREFEFALLQRAAGLGEDETAAGVEELVRRRILHGTGERFDFTHDRIREVAHGLILGPRRKMLHRRVAEGIEAIYAEDLEPHALALGLHYGEAEVWDQAATYLRRAGVAARTRAANREAVACIEKALAAADRLTEGPAKTEHAIDARVELELALMGLGEIGRGLERLGEAETLARAAGDRRRLGRVYYRMTYDLASLGDFPGALAKGEAATALATEEQDLRNLLGVNVAVCRALYGVGEYRRAIDVAQRNDDLVRAIAAQSRLRGQAFSVVRGVSFSHVWVVLAVAEVGRFSEGAALGEEAVAAAHEELSPHEQVWARLGLGRLYAVQGALERAIGALEPALPLCETSSDLAVYFSRTASSLGEAYARSGRTKEGLALLDRAASHAEAIGFAYSHALVVGTLGDALLVAGEGGEAAHRAGEALDLARRYGQRGWEAWALRLHGELAAHREPLDLAPAEAHFRAAAALAGDQGMRPLLAHCRLGLGTACGHAGMADRARAELAAALAEYRAMEMPYWRDRAAAELATVR
jgi:tetratricopeptide (TPR) repeat protein